MKVNLDVDIKDPMVPNFIIAKDDNHSIPISDFADDELRAIGARWTNELVKKAQEQRNRK